MKYWEVTSQRKNVISMRIKCDFVRRVLSFPFPGPRERTLRTSLAVGCLAILASTSCYKYGVKRREPWIELVVVKKLYFPVSELVTDEDTEKKKSSKTPKKLQRKRFHQGEQKRDDTNYILTLNKYSEFSPGKNWLLCYLQLSHTRCDSFHGSKF